MALKENMVSAIPVNASSSGAIAGIGIGPSGEPGIKKKKLRSIIPKKKEKN
jgi:hypothetical protein